MNVYVSQQVITTRTERVRKRVLYLEEAAGLRGQVVAAMRAYLAQTPQGAEVSLAALAALGRDTVERLAQARRLPSPNVVKQDIGAWTVLLLLEMFPAERVFTLRQLSDKGWVAANGRPAGGAWPQLDWVTTFTRHRVLQRGEASLWRAQAVAEANAEHEDPKAPAEAAPAGTARYPVYAVWRRLLAAMPDDLDEVEAVDYGRALFNQVVWRDRDILERALPDKLAALAGLPLAVGVRDEIEQIYRRALARRHLPGLGRFRGFGMGNHSLFSSGQVARFLRELRDLARCEDEDEARRRVLRLAGDATLPLGETPRFSECVHLSRPALPFLSIETREVMADLMNAAGSSYLDARLAYARHLEWMQRAQQLMGLASTNALDGFLLRFKALFHPRFPEVYREEMRRFEEDFRGQLDFSVKRPGCDAGGDEAAALLAAEPAEPYGAARRPQSPFRTNPRLVPELLEDPVLPLRGGDWTEGELWPAADAEEP